MVINLFRRRSLELDYSTSVFNSMVLRTLFINLCALVTIAAIANPGVAQAPPVTARGASIAVRIAIDKDKIPSGQSPLATLTIWNTTSDHIVFWEWDPYHDRVHIEGKSGEPPKTMWYRQLLREPGLPALETTLNAGPRAIFPANGPANSIDSKFSLAAFYDLSASGTYSACLEIWDESGRLLKTNAVQFEMLAPE